MKFTIKEVSFLFMTLSLFFFNATDVFNPILKESNPIVFSKKKNNLTKLVGINNLACAAGGTQITGVVFQDFNYNGDYDTGSDYLGIQGMAVTATDSLSNSFSTTTDSDGTYTINSLIANRTYRVEFTFPDALLWANATFYGDDNGTTVQFVKSGNCANLGVASPSDYCESNPLLAIPCYVNGNPLIGGTAGSGDWMVYFRNDNQGEVGSGGYIAPETYTDGQVIGATWGVAYHRETKNVLTAAVMRRHSGFGVNGTGAIYKVDENGTPLLFVDLNTYTNVNTGVDTRGSNANNTLPANFNVANRDIDAFQAVGKVGIGDIEMSADGQNLFAINLNERTLVQINIGSSLFAPATVDTFRIASAIDNLLSGTAIACGTAADYRPWALKYHRGKLYIGVVCSAEQSQTAADVHAYVLSFDPDMPANGFSLVLDMAMDYAREPAFQSDNASQTIPGTWRPWALSYTDATILSWNGGAHPSPILSDIEVDDDGSMILGFMDRFGMQSGYRQLSTDLGDSDANHQGMSAGDVIRFCNVNGSLVQEGGTGCGFNTSPLWTNPGTFVPQGEFYVNEEFFTTITNPSHGHPETSLGSLAFLPGSGEIVAGVFDPFALRSGGVAWWDNTNGGLNKEYELYESIDASTPDGSFSKATALGDIEFLCAVAPIQIGNYVWLDTNMDGIQDAGEEGIENITVELFDATGILLATTMTNSTGQYYFSGRNIDAATWATSDDTLQANTDYYIVVGNGQFASNELTIGVDKYELTIDSVNSGMNRYSIDSDGEVVISSPANAFNNLPASLITTSNNGEINHDFDFGFKPFNYDYGDLPDIAAGTTGITDYETYDSTGGPSHRIITGLFLGDTVDIDNDGFPNAQALGDDLDNVADEDGIAIFSSLEVRLGGIIRLPIQITNTTGNAAYLEAWIDWNGDGDFDEGNEMVVNVDNIASSVTTFVEINVPDNAQIGNFLGFRTRLSNTDNMTPYGRVHSGEVEDYLLKVACPVLICLPIDIELKRE